MAVQRTSFSSPGSNNKSLRQIVWNTNLNLGKSPFAVSFNVRGENVSLGRKVSGVRDNSNHSERDWPSAGGSRAQSFTSSSSGGVGPMIIRFYDDD